MPDGDLDNLGRTLADAGEERDVDLAQLADLTDEQLDYLARVGELEDPETDGIEGECV